MAGSSSVLILPRLQELPGEDRQVLLCSVCSVHNEIANNSLEIAGEVSKLFASEWPFFIDGRATCLDSAAG